MESAFGPSVEKQEVAEAAGPAPIAPHVAAVLSRLEDSDEEVRYAAVEALAELEPAVLAQHAATLVGKLEDSNSYVRWAAVKTLDVH